MINIIYILPSEKKPTGGIKITLDHSQIINQIGKNFNSKIIFLKKKKTSKWKNSLNKIINFRDENYKGWKFNDVSIDLKNKEKWFGEQINYKNNLDFDKQKDFVILPEIFAHFAQDFLIKKKINYAIFVQNGLALNFTNDNQALKEVYSKAKIIISVSKHIKECIKKAFKINDKKILEINQSFERHNLSLEKKQNLITYMPRKLPKHSDLVLFFLRNELPKKWKILAIENMNHKSVIKNLKKSKIFLSFSNLEGFGLPPVEAATLGNFVIGYTGEGGKEYFKKPMFKKIEQGDILNFVAEINRTIVGKFSKNLIKIHVTKLLNKYSKKNQNKKIINLLNNIKKYY